MSNHTRTTWATVYARLSAYDDVRVLKRVLLYTPDFSPRRVAAGVREYYKSAVAVLLVLASVGTSFGSVGLSGAFLSDTESSLANILQAQIHDFTGAVSPQLHSIDVGTPATVPVDITPLPGTHTFSYRVTTDTFSGSLTLCNAVTASLVTPFAYNGGLTTLDGVSFVVPDLSLNISLPVANGLVAGDQCSFDLVFRSWHTLVPESTGYTDEERIAVTLTYTPPGPPPPVANPADIVLNEFLPNPDPEAGGMNFGTDNSDNPLGEWIELYNKGPVAQDIAGWYITDASGGVGNTHAIVSASSTNTGGTVIAPGGWLVIFTGKPSLNNTGDEIYLFPVGTTVHVDFVTYEDPSSDCENDPTLGTGNVDTGQTGTPGNGNSGDCTANQVAPNKSYARIPDGTGPWIDPIPTPGTPNILDAESAAALGVTSEVTQDEPPVPEPVQELAPEPEPVQEPEPVPEPSPQPLEETPPPVVE